MLSDPVVAARQDVRPVTSPFQGIQQDFRGQAGLSSNASQLPSAVRGLLKRLSPLMSSIMEMGLKSLWAAANPSGGCCRPNCLLGMFT